jgi:hypothetical protein
MSDKGFDKAIRRLGITEDTMIHSIMQGGQDGGWTAEIHVRHPQGQYVAVTVAIPFDAAGAATLDGAVKFREVGRQFERTHCWQRMRHS